MFRNAIEKYIRKVKKNDFMFDKDISLFLILEFSLKKFLSILRSYKIFTITKGSKKVFLGRNVEIFNKKNIVMGDNVNIGDFVKLYALGVKPLTIGSHVNIGSFTQVIISTTFGNLGQFITLGNHVAIGEFSYVGGAGGLEIGENTIIGQYFSSHPENHNFIDKSLLIRLQGVNRQGIKIGKNCWLGSKVTILDGVIIGDNCVVAAGSVVTNSVPDNMLVGGVPARIIREIFDS